MGTGGGDDGRLCLAAPAPFAPPPSPDKKDHIALCFSLFFYVSRERKRMPKKSDCFLLSLTTKRKERKNCEETEKTLIFSFIFSVFFYQRGNGGGNLDQRFPRVPFFFGDA